MRRDVTDGARIDGLFKGGIHIVGDECDLGSGWFLIRAIGFEGVARCGDEGFPSERQCRRARFHFRYCPLS